MNVVKHIFRVHQIFASKIKSREYKYPRKFSLPIKGPVNTSRTLGKRQIKMQAKFIHSKIAKLRCSENIETAYTC